MNMRRLLAGVLPLGLLAGGVVNLASSMPPVAEKKGKPVKASDDPEAGMSRFQMDKRLKSSVWAAEPMMANPVSFTFDEKGRVFVCETFRHFHGVTDNRNHMNWLDEDLASRTVAERVEMLKKDAKDKFSSDYESARDRIQLLEDTTGSGKADKSTVFSDRFGRAEDGILAGVLARKGNVYVTCIPDLWKLQDTKGTGKADKEESLATGFGVHVAYLGHDLHGLTVGPDGKLYFSIGDRGLNVTTKEGKKLFYPDMGGVLRCDPDGANLEMVHKGLRNPQELAFDDFGNLFTVDNNSDSGDKARFTHIIEGGDSGWRTGYQYGTAMGNRGPFNEEGIWHLREPNQPTYITPPISHISDGPSGFVHYPGIGLEDRYKGHFFLADFRGSSGQSGIRSFATKPKGASFEMVDEHKFIWGVLATDCDFGPDGAFYLSDWLEGWNIENKGRIYKFTDAEALKNPDVAKAKELIASDLTKKSVDELIALLSFPQQRVRLEAQFALVEKSKKEKISEKLFQLADKDGPILPRIHAIWALGMILHREGVRMRMAGVFFTEDGSREYDSVEMLQLIKLIHSKDSEIRAQAVKTIGFTFYGHTRHISSLLKDANPRVQLLAAIACSKSMVDTSNIYPEVIEFIKANDDKDAYLRHAGVMILAAFDTDPLTALNSHQSSSVRLAALLALRHKNSPKVSAFFTDQDPLISTEAIRAAHDLELKETYPAIAARLSASEPNAWVSYRTLNANYRIGGDKNAEAIAQFAAAKDIPEKLRLAAVQMLATWAKPPRRDYVTGLTQNLGERDGAVAKVAFQKNMAGIFAAGGKVALEASKAVSQLNIGNAGPTLANLLADEHQKADTRIAALQGLEAIKATEFEEGLWNSLISNEAKLRNAGRAILAKSKPGEVIEQIAKVLKGTDLVEQQGVFPILMTINTKEADDLLAVSLDKLLAKQLAPELHLDILEAAKKSKNKEIVAKLKAYNDSRSKADELANYRESQFGGDAENGREILLKNERLQCIRCHKLDGTGGEVGPSLNGVGKQTREYLLESIVLPNKQIAKGFESVIIQKSDGTTVTGIVRKEDGKELTLINADGKIFSVKKEEIEDRKPSKTAMPEDIVTKMSKSDLRDLVEFLSSLKEEKK